MRIKGLDVLRGIAILLVILRHGSIDNNAVKEFGWLGVDLFFVISGVLVSGLIFKEYLQLGTVNVKRFLIRRGFKIYPSFYFFMIFSIMFHWFHTHTMYDTRLILEEAFYIQNYTDGIWLHTWSLDVEEHFYIVLALFSLIAIRTKILYQTKTVIISLLLLLTVSFLLRCQASLPHRNESFFFIIKTHLRSDGLIIGVLISYILHFTNWYQQIQGKEKYIFIAGLALTLPGFLFNGGSFIMNTWGITVVNIGFGLITFIAINYNPFPAIIYNIVNVPAKIISYIGKNSYSIYLWHITALNTVNFIFNYSKMVNFTMYFILSLFLGIALTYIIEKPFLRLRDRIIK
ncbi:MAG: acyltransferase [Bacteroidota bacterium]